MPLQIRRGTAAERNALSSPLVIGELLYTTDTGRLYIGDGTALGGPDIQGNPGEGGKGLTITGFTTEDAQDATATLFANGTHSNISFTYNDSADSISATVSLGNYTGNIDVDGSITITGSLQVGGEIEAAAFKGSVFADDSTLLVDAVSGTIPYSVISGTPTALSDFTNDVGYIRVADIADGTVTIDVNNTGDLQGSVYGDDSTLLVDAVNSIIPASIVSGTFTGNVIGNLSGVVTGSLNGDVTGGTISGDIVTTSISSADSSSINVTSPVRIDAFTSILSTLQVSDGGVFEFESVSGFPLAVQNSVNSSSVAGVVFRKSRGTVALPTAVQVGDKISSYISNAYDGSNYAAAGTLEFSVDDTVSSNVVPSKFRILNSDSSGTLIESLSIDSQGITSLLSALIKGTDGQNNESLLVISNHHDTTTNASNLVLSRTRGTNASPTTVQDTDPIFDLVWSGHDGTNLIGSSFIRTVVEGTVSTGIVPGRMDIYTQNASGAYGARMQINSAKIAMNVMPQLPTYADDTAADTAIGGAGNRVNGMMFYNTALGAIRAVVGGSWTSL